MIRLVADRKMESLVRSRTAGAGRYRLCGDFREKLIQVLMLQLFRGELKYEIAFELNSLSIFDQNVLGTYRDLPPFWTDR